MICFFQGFLCNKRRKAYEKKETVTLSEQRNTPIFLMADIGI